MSAPQWISDPYLWLPIELAGRLATIGLRFNDWQHRLVANDIVDAFIETGEYDLPAGRRNPRFTGEAKAYFTLKADDWADSLGLEPDDGGPMLWRYKQHDGEPRGFHTYQFETVYDTGGGRLSAPNATVKVDAMNLDDALRIASSMPAISDGHWQILNLRRVR